MNKAGHSQKEIVFTAEQRAAPSEDTELTARPAGHSSGSLAAELDVGTACRSI